MVKRFNAKIMLNHIVGCKKLIREYCIIFQYSLVHPIYHQVDFPFQAPGHSGLPESILEQMMAAMSHMEHLVYPLEDRLHRGGSRGHPGHPLTTFNDS